MSAARDEILGRVRSALGAGSARVEPMPEPERAHRLLGERTRAELVDLLAGRIAEYRATVRRVEPSGVRGAAAEICRAHRVRRLGVPPELPADWRPDGVELVEDSGLGPHQLDRLDGVLTACTLAIAETGTLVLTAGPRDGRRALTLVPDLHICVVHETQIVELLPEALERLPRTTPLTFVSGPSATSDIELSRVEGVHGPRRLEVILIVDQSCVRRGPEG